MLFILNKNYEVVESLNNRGNMAVITPYFDDEYLQDLATGAETFTFSTLGDSVQSQHLVVGNFIAFRYKDDYKLFNIINVDEEHTDIFIKNVYCEMASIELINEIVRPMNFSGTVRAFIETILNDTSWQLGIIDMGFNQTVDLELKDYKSVYSLLQEHMVKDFGAEISYRVVIKNQKLVGKFIDVYIKRGMDRGLRFAYSKNLTSIKRTIDSSNIATALIGIGKNNITFKDLDLPDKPAGQDFIEDEYAYKIWNVNGHHILGTFKAETDSPQELVKLTRKELEKRSTPNIKYEMKVELLGEDVEIGDTVSIVDHSFNPPIYLEGRINQLKISHSDPMKNECVLANFKELNTGISAELKELAGYVDSKFPVGTQDIKDGAINGDKLHNGQIIKGTHLFANSITADKIKAGEIKTEHLQAKIITSEKIQAGQILAEHLSATELITSSAQIGNAVIDSANINEGAITTAHIQDASIGTAQIKDLEVTVAKIEELFADKITATQGKFQSAHIGVLTSDNIDANTIKAEHITASVIDAINMSVSGTIDASKINVKDLVVDNIDAGSIVSGTIDADRINGSVISAINASIENAKIDSAKIGDLSADIITSGEISTDILKSTVISAINASIDVISADRIDVSSIKVDKIDAGAIVSGTVDADRITGSVVQAINLTSSQIDAKNINVEGLKVGGANIVEGSIVSAHIKNGQINNAHIDKAFVADGYIKNLSASVITSGTIDANKVTIRNLKADSIVAGSITVEGNNLIHNSAFEENTDKWIVNQGWSLDTNVKFEGVNSVKVDLTGLTSDSWRALMSERVPVNIGDSVVVSVWVYSDDISTLDRGAGLEVQWYADETSSRLPHQRGTSIAPTANGVWQRIVYTTVVDEPNTKFMDLRFHPIRNGRMWIAKPMVSKGTIASVWKKHNDELISNGAITNDKIANDSITADKLVIDSIWADEGFISNFQSANIDAGQITTGKITGEYIDISGLVSYDALDEELVQNFKPVRNPETGEIEKTWINGANIYTGSVTADKINTRGFTATDELGNVTFSISQETGEVNVRGNIASINYEEGIAGYRLQPNGIAEFNDAIVRGSVVTQDAGMTNYGSQQGGGVNLLLNSNFIKQYKETNGTSKHDNYYADYWGGYNSGIDNPTKSYHAHINNTKFAVPVYEFNETDGTRNWKGISQGGVQARISGDKKYILSLDAYATGAGAKCFGGFYYTKKGGTQTAFHAGQFAFTTKENFKVGKWDRYSVEVPIGADIDLTKNVSFYIYGYGFNDNSILYIKDVKLEEGDNPDKATPWSPAPEDGTALLRFWAGTDYNNRNKAPFKVLSDGSIIATKGEFGGVFSGKVDIGNITIQDTDNTKGSIEIKNNDNSKTLVHLSEDSSYFKSNLAIGEDFVNFSSNEKILNIKGRTEFNHGNYSTILNSGDEIIRSSDGRGTNLQRYNAGTYIFSATGTNQFGDYMFKRDDDKPVSIKVEGELYARDKITMNNNIAIVSRQDAGNSGFDYVVK